MCHALSWSLAIRNERLALGDEIHFVPVPPRKKFTTESEKAVEWSVVYDVELRKKKSAQFSLPDEELLSNTLAVMLLSTRCVARVTNER